LTEAGHQERNCSRNILWLVEIFKERVLQNDEIRNFLQVATALDPCFKHKLDDDIWDKILSPSVGAQHIPAASYTHV